MRYPTHPICQECGKRLPEHGSGCPLVCHNSPQSHSWLLQQSALLFLISIICLLLGAVFSLELRQTNTNTTFLVGEPSNAQLTR